MFNPYTKHQNHFIINQITVKHQVNEFKVRCVSIINWKHSQRSLSYPQPSLPHKCSFTEQMYNIMKNPTFCTILICNHVKLNLSLFGTILCTIMNRTSLCLESSNLRQTMRIQIEHQQGIFPAAHTQTWWTHRKIKNKFFFFIFFFFLLMESQVNWQFCTGLWQQLLL